MDKYLCIDNTYEPEGPAAPYIFEAPSLREVCSKLKVAYTGRRFKIYDLPELGYAHFIFQYPIDEEALERLEISRNKESAFKKVPRRARA